MAASSSSSSSPINPSDVPEEGSVVVLEYIGRKKITLQSHLERYDELIRIIGELSEKKRKKGEKGSRIYSTLIRHLKEMRTEVPKVAKNMNKRKPSTKPRISGFSMRCSISDELADFLKVPKGSLLTRAEITNALCAYVNIKPDETREKVLRWKHLNPKSNRDLRDPKNKTRILPDARLSKLLKYEAYRKNVKEGLIETNKVDKQTKEKRVVKQTDDGLMYPTMQILIQPHISKVE